MRRSYWWSSCLAFATTIAAGAQAQVPLPLAGGPADTLRLSLTQSIDIALQQATLIQTSRADQRVAAAQLLSAYGRFLPAVGVGANTYGETGTPLLSSTALAPYNATFHGATIGLVSGVTLFDGFSNQAALRAALAERSAAGLTLVRAREEVTNDVTEAFFRVVLDDRLIGVAQANLALSRQRLAQLDEQVQAGVRAPPDLYRQQALASADETEVIAAQARRSADRIGLLRRLRLDPMHPVELLSPAPSPAANLPASGQSIAAMQQAADTFDVASLSRAALAQRSDLAAADAQRRAAEEAIAQARGALLPRVALEFDLVDQSRIFNRQVQNGVDLLNTPGAPIQAGTFSQLGHQVAGVVTLGVSMPLFDRWQTRAEVERAQALADVSRLREDDLHDRVVGEVAQAVDEIRSAAQTLVSATAQTNAAQLAYDAVSGRYDVGLANFIDVASSQTELTRARSSVEAAIVNQAVARAHLVTALGNSPRADDGRLVPPRIRR